MTPYEAFPETPIRTESFDPDKMPDWVAKCEDIDLLRRYAWEAECTKQLLRRAGFGVTGMRLYHTAKEAVSRIFQ